jgi:hypothetical protein
MISQYELPARTSWAESGSLGCSEAAHSLNGVLSHGRASWKTPSVLLLPKRLSPSTRGARKRQTDVLLARTADSQDAIGSRFFVSVDCRCGASRAAQNHRAAMLQPGSAKTASNTQIRR